MYHLLIIEDNKGTRISLAAKLRAAWERHCEQSHVSPLYIHYCETLAEAKQHLEEREFSAVLLDLKLPDSDPQHTLDWLSENAPRIPPVVVITFMEPGGNSSGWEIPSLANGASDFIAKADIFSASGSQQLMKYVLKAMARGKYLSKRRELYAT